MQLIPYRLVDKQFWLRWNEINETSFGAHPLLQARFVVPMLEHFADGFSVLLDGGQSDFQNAILLDTKRRFGNLIATGVNPPQSQINLSLIGDNGENFLTQALRALGHSVQRLDLFFVDERYQPALASHTAQTERSPKGTNMSVEIQGAFDDYWKARPKNLRKNISRYLNRAEREGAELEFKQITDRDSLPLAIARYGMLESQGWKGLQGTAIHPGNQQGIYYETALLDYATTGDACVYELWSEDKLIASRLCIGNDKMLIPLKTTFDENSRNLAPGRLLLWHILKELFAHRRYEVMEFYTSATKEQIEWSTSTRNTTAMSLYKAVPYSLVTAMRGSQKADS